ncbi:PEBP family protein [Reinekea thalattae]|uniref:PEBP family protein n=1 Tax=Reinekea thalattae TaxID=2593301 RepID=A0A5C8ZB40_9GAMM|nr:PEBP family protein [Reinekea thalattae]TXR54106.1 PEBP family protein [Reinekea thalattae]
MTQLNTAKIALLTLLCATYSAADETTHYRLDAWSDNWFAAYIDGELLIEDSVPITTERSFNAESIEFQASKNFQFAFILKDFIENDTGLEYINTARQQMGDGGFIFQLTELTTNQVVAVSNQQMRCQVIHKAPLDKACEDSSNPQAGVGLCQFERSAEPENWQLASFDDSHWPAATEHSVRAVSPKGGYNQIRWHDSATFVWGSDLEQDNTLLCRVSIAID